MFQAGDPSAAVQRNRQVSYILWREVKKNNRVLRRIFGPKRYENH
jgi:hypothetical protein